jgi:hypothetical protein
VSEYDDSQSQDSSTSLSDIVSGLGNAVKTGAAAYQAVAGGNNPATNNSTARAAAAPAPASFTQYLPWAIGGVIVLVIVALFVRK